MCGLGSCPPMPIPMPMFIGGAGNGLPAVGIAPDMVGMGGMTGLFTLCI